MCNITLKDVDHVVEDSFWKDVLKAWVSTYPQKVDNPTKVAIIQG